MLILLGTETVVVEPLAMSGLGLRCRLPAGPGRLETTVFVTEQQAIDRAAFWAAWERLGGAGQELRFESGQVYSPAGGSSGACPTGRCKRPVPGWLKWLLSWFYQI
jgi:hypothetical protein